MNKRVDYHNPITHESEWRGFELTDSQAEDGFYTKILEKTIIGLEELFSHHKRINIIRFDLYFKNDNEQYIDLDTNTNELVSRFFKNLKRRLERWEKYNKRTESFENRGIKRIVYQAVREESSQKRAHYHCYIAIPSQVKNENDGRIYADKSGEYIWIYKIIAETWRAVIDCGRVNFGTNGYNSHFYWLNYNSATFQDNFSDCFKGLSYIAKAATKNQGQKHSKRYFASTSIARRDAGIRLEYTSIDNRELEVEENYTLDKSVSACEPF